MNMKKYLLIAFLLLVSGTTGFAQFTASLANRTASPNDTVKVNLHVTGFSNVASFTFNITIDTQVLTYQGITGAPSSGFNANLNGNTISMVWSSTSNYLNISNGVLLTINFKYNGLTSPIDFVTNLCEVVKMQSGLPVVMTGTYSNGSVTPYLYNASKAFLDTLRYVPLGVITDTLRYTGFSNNVGSITQRISYDPAVLNFINVAGTGSLATGVTTNISSPGIITITWSSATPKNINYPGSYFKLNFQYLTATPTNIGFSTGCIIETTTPVSNIKVSYFHGRVIPPLVITSYAQIDSVSNGIQGQIVNVPVFFQNMPGNTTNFNMNITFDSPRLSFLGILNPVQPVISNVSGNVISITNANTITPTPSINGTFLVLRFQYNGVGTANVMFAPGCQFSTNSGPVGVGFTNGAVIPGIVPGGHNANIGYSNRIGAGPVTVPVYFNQMPSNIGAITMFMLYDVTKLTYTSVINPYGATVKVNGNIINVAWSSGTAFSGDTLVKLQFNYIPGSGSNCAAPITFTDGCQIANLSAVIIPTNWNSGGVNVKFKISGSVKYNSDPMPRIPLVGHRIILKSNTGDSITSGISDNNGNYEFWAGNGNYTLQVIPNSGYASYSDLDDVLAIYNDYLGYPIPLSDLFPIRLIASDLNENGYIDLDDAIYIYNLYLGYGKSPDWTAPDWIYEEINVTCNCSNLSGIQILGLNSGNVLGTNPTP
jgi:hypothetical protein